MKKQRKKTKRVKMWNCTIGRGKKKIKAQRAGIGGKIHELKPVTEGFRKENKEQQA